MSVKEVFNVVTQQFFAIDANIKLVEYQILECLLDVSLADQHSSNHSTSTHHRLHVLFAYNNDEYQNVSTCLPLLTKVLLVFV